MKAAMKQKKIHDIRSDITLDDLIPVCPQEAAVLQPCYAVATAGTFILNLYSIDANCKSKSDCAFIVTQAVYTKHLVKLKLYY